MFGTDAEKTSLSDCGEVRHFLPLLVYRMRKRKLELKIIAINFYKANGICMFMWMKFICDITGGEFEDVAILIAIVVNVGGYGDVLRCY